MLFGDEHVRRYEETDGAEGHDWQDGSKTLILTTTGRRSGEPRKMALIYGQHGEDYLVVGSKGGADKHPSWYLNLRDNPDVTVAFAGKPKRAMRARTASPEERATLWPRVTASYKGYAGYQTKTDREIPLVLLEPVGVTAG